MVNIRYFIERLWIQLKEQMLVIWWEHSWFCAWKCPPNRHGL